MGYNLRKEDETNEQCQVIYWLRLKYPKVKTIISPIVKFGTLKQRIIHGKIMKGMGYCKGTLDIFIPEPRNGFHGLFVEMKTKEGRIEPDQEEMAEYHLTNGYQAKFCWSYEEAVAVIDNYLMGVK